jgi:hypothetical protein
MREVTIYTCPPSRTCAKTASFLGARGVERRLGTVEGDDDLDALVETLTQGGAR